MHFEGVRYLLFAIDNESLIKLHDIVKAIIKLAELLIRFIILCLIWI